MVSKKTTLKVARFYRQLLGKCITRFSLVYCSIFPFCRIQIKLFEGKQMSTLRMTLCRKIIKLCKTSRMVHLYIRSMLCVRRVRVLILWHPHH